MFVWLFMLRFKDEDKIDLNEHKWIIILYLVLMILAIATWRVVYLLIVVNFEHIISINTLTQSYINGQE
jgi:hypothetical protein